MDVPSLIRPWTEDILAELPGIRLFDAHTHIGQNDPDGMRCTPAELSAFIRDAGAVGCFVFPMHEPGGYPQANDMVIEAARSLGEGFVPFLRVDPNAEPLREAERALAAGARGIKLHPRAERFTLDHPEVDKLVALAAERNVPVLIHAGRGIPALGLHAVELAGRHPEARVILAHAAICDLSWLPSVAPDHPNLLFDTSWFMPGDLKALFGLIPPGQIVFASDAPYGATLASAAIHLRYARHAGLSEDQLRLVAGGQALHLAGGEPLEQAGPAVGERERAPHVLLDRITSFVLLGTLMVMRHGDGEEMISLAEQACKFPDGHDDAPVAAAVRNLIAQYRQVSEADPADRRALIFLILAIAVSATPEIPLPPGLPPTA